MIRVEQLSFGYGKRPVLQEIDLQIRAGEILSILGPNGCGKSTLLGLLRGQLQPQQGAIYWQGQPLSGISRKQMARLAAVVQQSAPVNFPYPVRELVKMGRYARATSWWGGTAGDREVVERALAVTDTLHLAGRPATDLSGGELQRVLLARALAQQTPVLLLDEATSHLDLDHRLELAHLLVRLNREQNTTVVQVSHDLDLAAETSERILLLDGEGRIVALGTPAEVLTAENIRRVFKVEVQVEASPWTGAPRIYVTSRTEQWQQPPRVHVICGGGSGGDLLRRLHVAGCQLSVGPLNRGDSDQELAAALGLATSLEQPFCRMSPASLQAAEALCRQAGLLVIAATCWGPGNLPALALAREARQRGQHVLLIAPDREQDFTGGQAWQQLQALLAEGAEAVKDVEGVLKRIKAIGESGG